MSARFTPSPRERAGFATIHIQGDLMSQDVDSGVPTTPAASPDSIELQATSDANGAAEEGMQTPPVRERDLFGGSLAVSSPGFVRVGKKTGVKIPETPEGITKEWLTQVYQNRGYLREGGHVSEVNIKPLGDTITAGETSMILPGLVSRKAQFVPRGRGALGTHQDAWCAAVVW